MLAHTSYMAPYRQPYQPSMPIPMVEALNQASLISNALPISLRPQPILIHPIMTANATNGEFLFRGIQPTL